ncbi:ubiquitin conjugating enzyme [Didymella exigua CBS 183.55]|uniref:Ubiquitin-conjugating enzyme E2 2 n=1 Tax=Didymella exigua CBS 183.55 TaxID=1150837 RepID=A0A6A5RUA7_9PLEO|nr:ubiquitin conjugating enzyme [Didymella exigua CBS 183.55]KAF1932021.1 ubiquitin conjugating enzyme [Didymella exigua CBS 183.55]
MFASRRLSKELTKMQGQLPLGITLVSADNFETWFVDIQVIDPNPLYANETYRLKFMFSQNYPIEPPEVVFVKDDAHPIPWHPHIYTNGIICLDLLDRSGWSPVHNVESVCVSLQSMLTSNTKKERPPGDDNFVRYNRQRPRDLNFVFHDNQV